MTEREKVLARRKAFACYVAGGVLLATAAVLYVSFVMK